MSLCNDFMGAQMPPEIKFSGGSAEECNADTPMAYLNIC